MRVYTRKGDDGTTGLLYGGRVDKDDVRTTAYGTVDELVSVLGLARAELESGSPGPGGSAADGADAQEPDRGVEATSPDVRHERILDVQRELFALAAQLATDGDNWDRLEVGVSCVDQSLVDRLEELIDACVERHPPPREFVVPGGTRLAAALDLARTVCRRAERSVVAMRRADLLPDEAPLRYLNRLSDYLYVLAREAEQRHVPSRRRGGD